MLVSALIIAIGFGSIPDALCDTLAAPKDTNCGIKLELSKRGLDYTNDVVTNLLVNEFRATKVSNSMRKFAGGIFSLQNVRVTDITNPDSSYTLSNNDNNKIKWRFSGGQLRLHGDWSYFYRMIFAPVTIRGTADITAFDYKIDLTAELPKSSKTSENGLRFVNPACRMRSGHFHVDLDGGSVLGTILNWFRGLIANAVQPELHSKVCAATLEMVNTYINGKLAGFPKRVPLLKSSAFYLDNSIESSFPKMHKDAVVCEQSGRIMVNDAKVQRSADKRMPADPLAAYKRRSEKMVNIYIGDVLLNSLFQIAHDTDRSTLQLTSANASSYPFMSKECDKTDFCMSSLFPTLWQRSPTIDPLLVIKTLEPIRAAISGSDDPLSIINESTDQSISSINGSVNLALYLSDGQVVANDSAMLDIDIQIFAELYPFLMENERNRIACVIKIVNTITKINANHLQDSVSDEGMAVLLDYVLPMVETEINKKLKVGVEIPWIENVEFVHPRLTLLSHTAVIATDLLYVAK